MKLSIKSWETHFHRTKANVYQDYKIFFLFFFSFVFHCFTWLFFLDERKTGEWVGDEENLKLRGVKYWCWLVLHNEVFDMVRSAVKIELFFFFLLVVDIFIVKLVLLVKTEKDFLFWFNLRLLSAHFFWLLCWYFMQTNYLCIHT